MLFNSFEFILLFLPGTYIFYVVLTHYFGNPWPIIVLVVVSLFFYGWWDFYFLLPLLLWIAFNYLCFLWILGSEGRQRLVATSLSVIFDLGVLFYFKYFSFLVREISGIVTSETVNPDIVLPIGISFITFQMIAFLIDTHRGLLAKFNFRTFLLFVLFFPHLIAGPIVHFREMMPQFERPRLSAFRRTDFVVGLTIFIIGLFKKVVIADYAAHFATPIFDLAVSGGTVSFFEAWTAAFAYTFQIYFDFSGYSDMAMGLARLFGINLVINFYSPYKASSIIDFWRRWHISLSRFLRDYLYFPLGGNRHGYVRTYMNIAVVMVLGGVWHGANWTFLLWGALHGVYIIINHLWRALPRRSVQSPMAALFTLWSGRAVTLLLVAIAWVFFRATDVHSALLLLSSMFGLNGVGVAPSLASVFTGLDIPLLRFDGFFPNGLYPPTTALYYLFCLLAIVWLLPNTTQLMSYYHFPFDEYHFRDIAGRNILAFRWRPTPSWAVAVLGGLLRRTYLMGVGTSEFLYFQF